MRIGRDRIALVDEVADMKQDDGAVAHRRGVAIDALDPADGSRNIRRDIGCVARPVVAVREGLHRPTTEPMPVRRDQWERFRTVIEVALDDPRLEGARDPEIVAVALERAGEKESGFIDRDVITLHGIVAVTYEGRVAGERRNC